MTVLFFDESGHTGSNYLDRNQPVLVGGALRSSEDESKGFRETYFADVKAVELSHANLTTDAQRRMILHFVEAERSFIAENFKWFLIHKELALVAKYFDLMVEPVMEDLGENAYKGGMNVGMINVIPVLIEARYGKEAYSGFLKSFSEFIREPSLDTLTALERVLSGFNDPEDNLAGLLRVSFYRFGSGLVDRIKKKQLDLTFTSAYSLAHLWRSDIEGPITLVHDETSALSRQERAFRNLTDPTQAHLVRKFGTKKVPTNVPIDHLVFGQSRDHAGLQICDVLSGAHAAAARWLAMGGPEKDWYGRTMFETLGKELHPSDSIWPDPKAVDTSAAEEDETTIHDVNAVLQELAIRSGFEQDASDQG